MASTHKHLRSSTANKRPTTSIADGQIALNTNSTSPGLFFKDSTGATIIKVGPVHVGTTAPNATPASGGSTGNSTGEIWLDTSLTPNGVKIWNGSAWVNATPVGSTTVQGLLELATSAETQAGSDTDRAVTPAGLQSKLSDSTSTTSSTTIASSTAVKAAYDLANAALPKSGGTITGALEIGTTGSLVFEGSTTDAFETTIAVTDPTLDRTITLPDQTGTVIVSGNASIVDADINAGAEIAVSKLADGTARQLLQTDAAGTGVEWTNNVDIPGTLDVTQAATFDSTLSFPLGTAALPSIYPGSDTNTGIYSPGADQVAISTDGSERARIDSSGKLLVGTSVAVSTRVSATAITAPFQVAGTTFGSNSLLLASYNSTTASGGGYLLFSRSKSGAVGTDTAVADGDRLGSVSFAGFDGTQQTEGARIAAEVDGTPGTNDMPGRLVFSTTADGVSTTTEVMRLTSDSYMRMASGTGGIQFNGDTAATNALNDYEEGTWTVRLYDAATGGNASSTTVTGTYTKIGRQVTARFALTNISTAGMTAANVLYFTLPFTSDAGSYTGTCDPDTLDFAAGRTMLLSYVINSSRGYFLQAGDNISDTTTLVSHVTSGTTDLRAVITYFV